MIEDFSILENRFQELIKQRLSLEIERHPPLFPWETDIMEYPTEIYEEVAPSKIPSWLSELVLPVKFPIKILSELVQACSQMIDSLDPQPMQMVKVVSQLFPQDLNFLHQQAGIIAIAGCDRSATTTATDQELWHDLEDYENCSCEQQMTLSLLAAQQILNALILNISPQQPFVRKEWQIPEGKIFVKADYLIAHQQIRVEIKAPDQGEISWHNQNKMIKVNCDTSESVTFYFTQVQENQVYTVNVNLVDPNATFFSFGLKIKAS
jgi:hypothetical protein